MRTVLPILVTAAMLTCAVLAGYAISRAVSAPRATTPGPTRRWLTARADARRRARRRRELAAARWTAYCRRLGDSSWTAGVELVTPAGEVVEGPIEETALPSTADDTTVYVAKAAADARATQLNALLPDTAR